jgi:hypothetical protein
MRLLSGFRMRSCLVSIRPVCLLLAFALTGVGGAWRAGAETEATPEALMSARIAPI